MAGRGIIKLAAALAREPEVLRAYGGKAAGYARLLELQEIGARHSTPVLFDVPEAFGLPPRSEGDFSARDLAETFRLLTEGRAEGVLLARSSHLAEGPEQNPTLAVRFDPTDGAQSYLRFKEAVDRLRQSDPGMGVVATAMVVGRG